MNDMKKKGIKKGKLQIRITRIVLFPVLVAFFMIFIVVISTSYNYYRTQEIINQRNQVDKTAAQISNLQSTISNIAKQVIYDDVVQKGIARLQILRNLSLSETKSAGNPDHLFTYYFVYS